MFEMEAKTNRQHGKEVSRYKDWFLRLRIELISTRHLIEEGMWKCNIMWLCRKNTETMPICNAPFLFSHLWTTSGEGYKTLFRTFLGHVVPHKLRQGHFSTYFISMYAAEWRSGAASDGKPPGKVSQLRHNYRPDLRTSLGTRGYEDGLETELGNPKRSDIADDAERKMCLISGTAFFPRDVSI